MWSENISYRMRKITKYFSFKESEANIISNLLLCEVNIKCISYIDIKEKWKKHKQK